MPGIVRSFLHVCKPAPSEDNHSLRTLNIREKDSWATDRSMKELIEGPLSFHLLVSRGFKFMEIVAKLKDFLQE